jgi:hypothetical protein
MDHEVPKPVMKGRIAVCVGVMVIIALIHAFRIGTYLPDRWLGLYYSFFSDIVMPFGIYFMLCIYDINWPLLRGWYTKALLVFAACAATEVAQAFGLYMLGVTFDPLDFAMFAAGVLLAVFVDRVAFTRALSFWPIATEV